jgi:hypothetical protein
MATAAKSASTAKRPIGFVMVAASFSALDGGYINQRPDRRIPSLERLLIVHL